MVKLSKKNKILVGAVCVIVLLFFVIFGMYKWGASSKNARIANLNAHLDAEAKKAAGWWNIAKAAQESGQKVQVVLKEKDAEIAAKKAALEVCEDKVAQLSKPPARPKREKVEKEIASAKAAVMAPKAEKTSEPGRPIPAPVPAPITAIVVPASTATPQLILRINVVEWSPVFQGKSLLSRDIGPVVRQGLADGTVVRAKGPQNFVVNGANVVVNDGSAIVNPGPVSAATALVIRPVDGARFASPPNGLPLTTNPGELYGVAQSGVSEIWLNFILAPAAVPPPPVEKKNLGGPKGLPSLLLFL